jgi:hypothetical protein
LATDFLIDLMLFKVLAAFLERDLAFFDCETAFFEAD